jgi:hypothetical protein
MLRKLLLEMLLRLPYNEYANTNHPINAYFRQSLKQITQTLIVTVQKENEGNVRMAIQVLCNLLKTFRPPFSNEVGVDPFIHYLIIIVGQSDGIQQVIVYVD